MSALRGCVLRQLRGCFAGEKMSFARAVSRGYGNRYALRQLSSSQTVGFSHPGARKLEEIVKLQLLNKHGSGGVRDIWGEYHREHKSAVGDVLSKEEYGLLRQRAQRCRHFVLPVFREGGYFTLFVEFQDKQCFMTFLDEYRKNGGGAKPWMSVCFYDELVESKGICLVRGEVGEHLKREEGKRLVELLKEFYIGERRKFDTVVGFNERGGEFEFEKVLKLAGGK